MEFHPQNELEKSLIRASVDPLAREQFLWVLMDSDVFIVPHNMYPEKEETIMLDAGTELSIVPIVYHDISCLPIYSSLDRLRQFVQSETSYLKLSAKSLMVTTRGADLFLNPGAAYGKHFTATEIERLLQGKFIHEPETRTLEHETRALIGQPKIEPVELKKALNKYLKGIPEVRAAYVCLIALPKSGGKPNTLLTLEIDGDVPLVISKLSPLLSNVQVPDPPLDMTVHVTGTPLPSMLHGQKPFYRRKLFGLF